MSNGLDRIGLDCMQVLYASKICFDMLSCVNGSSNGAHREWTRKKNPEPIDKETKNCIYFLIFLQFCAFIWCHFSFVHWYKRKKSLSVLKFSHPILHLFQVFPCAICWTTYWVLSFFLSFSLPLIRFVFAFACLYRGYILLLLLLLLLWWWCARSRS